MDVWWKGEKEWFTAKVIKEREEWHTKEKEFGTEILCRYILDNVEEWHALYNNKIRVATFGEERGVCLPTRKKNQKEKREQMLTASVLAELEKATPTKRKEYEYAASALSESASTCDSSQDGNYRVGVPKQVHSKGTTDTYNSVKKWVIAALKKIGKKERDLVLYPGREPNDQLVSEVYSILTEWYISKTTGFEAKVVDDRHSEMKKSPPEAIQSKAMGWILRTINQLRAEILVGEVDKEWGKRIAGRRGNTREVNRERKERNMQSGKIYSSKQDLAPSQDQLTRLCYISYSADQRVHSDVLPALEAGVAMSIYMPTGARGSELKNMHLQSLGHEKIEDEKSGLIFDVLKLTAFETKTKQHHLNLLLPHSNPWRCGVGALGVSILIRVKMYGPPPFEMQTNKQSWYILGTSDATMDNRLKESFKVAGIRRQNGDPLT